MDNKVKPDQTIKANQMRELVNTRILIMRSSGNSYSSAQYCDEITVIEVSPAGNFIKVMDQYGRKEWKPIETITPLEILPVKEKHPRSIKVSKPGEVSVSKHKIIIGNFVLKGLDKEIYDDGTLAQCIAKVLQKNLIGVGVCEVDVEFELSSENLENKK